MDSRTLGSWSIKQRRDCFVAGLMAHELANELDVIDTLALMDFEEMISNTSDEDIIQFSQLVGSVQAREHFFRVVYAKSISDIRESIALLTEVPVVDSNIRALCDEQSSYLKGVAEDIAPFSDIHAIAQSPLVVSAPGFGLSHDTDIAYFKDIVTEFASTCENLLQQDLEYKVKISQEWKDEILLSSRLKGGPCLNG